MPSTETPAWRSDQGTPRRAAAGSEVEEKWALKRTFQFFCGGGVVSLHESEALLSEKIKLNKKAQK